MVPKNLLYFANPQKESLALSSDYIAIMNASADTLKQDPAMNDGAYSAEAGFGYTALQERCATATPASMRACAMRPAPTASPTALTT